MSAVTPVQSDSGTEAALAWKRHFLARDCLHALLGFQDAFACCMVSVAWTKLGIVWPGQPWPFCDCGCEPRNVTIK